MNIPLYALAISGYIAQRHDKRQSVRDRWARIYFSKLTRLARQPTNQINDGQERQIPE